MEQSKRTCPKCGSDDYVFRGRKKIAAKEGQEEAMDAVSLPEVRPRLEGTECRTGGCQLTASRPCCTVSRRSRLQAVP